MEHKKDSDDYIVISEKIIPPQGRRKVPIVMQSVLPKNMDWEYFYEYIKNVYKIIDPELYNKIENELKKKEELKQKREEARIKYKPRKISHLIIAEAPPDGDRFFYFEELDKQKDYLFKNLMIAIYGHYDKKPKKEYLEDFKKDGYYLIDFLDYPIQSYKDYKKGKENIILKDTSNQYYLSEKIKALIKEMRINKPTKVILIKKSVFESFPKEDFESINIVNKNIIPFPSTGQQNNFLREIKKVI